MIMWRWTVMLQTALNQLSGGASGTLPIVVNSLPQVLTK